VAAPPARGAPRTQRGLVLLLLLCGLLLRHVSDHLLPSANFGRATLKGSAALFLRGACIVGPLAPLSRAGAARRTCARPLRRSSRCAGSFNHRDAPLGCGSGMNVTPSLVRARPTASSSGTRPQKRSIARPPRRRITRGRRSASSRSSHGVQRAISAGDGRRSPLPVGDFPGKHFVIAVRYGRWSSSIPASPSHRLSSAPERPLKGCPVVSSTAPGAWPTIAMRSRVDPATTGRARSRNPASTHFVHARMRSWSRPSVRSRSVPVIRTCQLADYRSGCRDSNPGPPEPHSGTLPGCATPRKSELAT
jgi:hypothetical protein